MPLQNLDQKTAADLKDEEQPLLGSQPGGSGQPRRRKTDVKQPRLSQNANITPSLPLETLKTSPLAEHHTKIALSDSDEKSSKCNVERQRSMKSPKNSKSSRNHARYERPWRKGRSWYRDYYWCTSCSRWIKKKSAKIKENGRVCCPRCGKRLRVRPTKKKAQRTRHRKQKLSSRRV